MLRFHAGRDRLREIKGGSRVDLEYAVPVRLADVFQRSAHLSQDAARVVDQDMRSLIGRQNLINKSEYFSAIPNIDHRDAAAPADVFAELFRLGEFIAQHIASPN